MNMPVLNRHDASRNNQKERASRLLASHRAMKPPVAAGASANSAALSPGSFSWGVAMLIQNG